MNASEEFEEDEEDPFLMMMMMRLHIWQERSQKRGQRERKRALFLRKIGRARPSKMRSFL